MTIVIGLIDYRSWDHTRECIASLAAMESDKSIVVVVIDNGDTVPDLVGPTPWPIRVIRPGTNTGFAGGVNLIFEYARAENASFVWLLNNDCTVSVDALSRLHALAKNVEADVYTSISEFGASGSIWFGGGVYDSRRFRFSHAMYGSPLATIPSDSWRIVDWASGANMYIPIRTVHAYSGFDENLFLYLEEVDWQLTNRLKVVMIEASLVRHFAGGSTGGETSGLETFFRARNSILLMRKLKTRVRVRWVWSWVREFLVVPTIRMQFARTLNGLLGLYATRRSGSEALALFIRL